MLKSQIEAVLFLTDKPLKAAAVARTLNLDVQVVRQALLELINDYECRGGGLEIADDNGYIIQVKDEYSSIINEFAPLEMPVALLRTLSAIAIKQPVQQSDVIKIRGAGAYDHIKELISRELIIKKDADEGRSPMLSTTKKFQEYFRLSGDGKSLRTELRKEHKVEGKETATGQPVQLHLEQPNDLEGVSSEKSAPVDTDMAPDQAVVSMLAGASVNEIAPVEKTTGALKQVETVESKLETASQVETFEPTWPDEKPQDDESAPDQLLVQPTPVKKLQELFDSSPDNALVFRASKSEPEVEDEHTVASSSTTPASED